MFVINLGDELFDEETNTFLHPVGKKLHLEHSLLSISKWEAEWEIPFLNTDKTSEQSLSYIKCCVLDDDFDELLLNTLSDKNILDFNAYLSKGMTAKKIIDLRSSLSQKRKSRRPASQKALTSEDIYYSMIQFHVWKECEEWPLQRLLSLLQLCSLKSNSTGEMSKSDQAKFYREENARRKAKYHTNG